MVDSIYPAHKTLQEAIEEGIVEICNLTDYCYLEDSDLSMKLDINMLENYKIRLQGNNITLVKIVNESI